jgi:hypothetical protein
MKPNDTDRSDTSRRAIVGVRKHFAGLSSVVLGGVPRTPDDVAATLQASIDATDAAKAAEAAYHKAVLAKKAADDAKVKGTASTAPAAPPEVAVTKT